MVGVGTTAASAPCAPSPRTTHCSMLDPPNECMNERSERILERNSGFLCQKSLESRCGYWNISNSIRAVQNHAQQTAARSLIRALASMSGPACPLQQEAKATRSTFLMRYPDRQIQVPRPQLSAQKPGWLSLATDRTWHFRAETLFSAAAPSRSCTCKARHWWIGGVWRKESWLSNGSVKKRGHLCGEASTGRAGVRKC